MIPKTNKRFRNDILYIRRSKGISQKQLAETIDIPRYKLSYIENGHILPTKEVLDKLKKKLNCLICEIYPLEVQKIILNKYEKEVK